MKATHKIVAGVTLLAAVYAGSAWYLGKKAEAEIYSQVEQLNAAVATHLAVNLEESQAKLRVVSYDRHWFSAKINYELVVQDAEHKHQILFQDHLRHGPLPLTALGHGHWRPMLAYSELTLLPTDTVQMWFEAAQNQAPLVAKTVIGLDGATQSQLDFAALDYSDAAGNKFTATAAQAQIQYQFQKEQLQVQADLPSLSWLEGEDKTQIQLLGTMLESNLSGFSSAQQASARIQSTQLRMDWGQSTHVVVDNLKMISDYALHNELLDSAVQYDLGQIYIDDHDLGQVVLAVDVKRLDYQVLNALSQHPDLEQMDEEAIRPYAQKLLAHRPEVNLNQLTLSNPAGTSELVLRMHLAPTALDEDVSSGIDLAHYVESLQMQLQTSRSMIQGYFAEESILSSLADMLLTRFAEQLQEVGLIEYDGDALRFALQFDAQSNQLLLNQKPITAEELAYLIIAMQMGGLF